VFLNPDALLDEEGLTHLVKALDDPRVGVAGPRIVGRDGALDYSQRRFPRLRSTFAQAFFLHRLFPAARWTDEVVRDRAAYEVAGPTEWLSGACLAVRRELLEQLGGFDEGFFMYCEDKDLCRRAWDAGYQVVYLPTATASHDGGGSAPRSALLPVLAASRIRYAEKHGGRAGALLERLGVATTALTHMLVPRKSSAVRAGHAHALMRALRAG
jgi:GT2 family glycosyltransferase